MAKPKVAKSYRHKPRRFVFLLYRVAWPNDVSDFRREVPVRRRQEIAQRLIAYLVFPPPVLAGPGGRQSKKSKLTSDLRKQKAFEKAKDKVRTQLRTYMAYEAARQLAVYESENKHHEAADQEYNAAFEDFRRFAGFGRLLSKDGRALTSRELGKRKWSRLVGAFLVFDLIARYAQKRDHISETQARLVVLLCQDLYGLEINHVTLSQACKEYRAVQHLLVSIIGVCLEPNKELGRYIVSKETRRSTLQLRKVLTQNLSGVLARAKPLERLAVLNAKRNKKKSQDELHDLVRLPNELLVPRAGKMRRGFDVEEKLVSIVKVGCKIPDDRPIGGKPKLRRIKHKDITSTISRSMRNTVLSTNGPS